MNNKVKNRRSPKLMAILLTAIVAVIVSCDDIYDNVEKYATSETIYADKLDGIVRVQIGYERVEIDLLRAGRIPSSQIIMAKAKKTVIECEDFTEPNHRRVIDSICSWVNVTGLTQLKNYQLTIYTEDEFGNRSLPFEVEVKPYTAENRDALSLPLPSVIESTSAAMVEWTENISAKTHTVYRHAFQYTDRDGVVHTGSEQGDLPSFFVENVEKGKDIPIMMTCRIIPSIMNYDGTYTPILDSIDWQSVFNLRISEAAVPAIFLKTPGPTINIDINHAEATFPLLFSWTTVPEAFEYALKISASADFTDETTYTINVGDVGDYIMDLTDGLDFINSFPKVRQLNLYWTVMPVVQSEPVKNQVRNINAHRLPQLVGKWMFNNESNIGAATVGEDLILFGSGFTPVDGPTATNKGVRVAPGSYFKCMHGLPHGSDNYTIVLRVKKNTAVNNGIIQLDPTDYDNPELVWNNSFAQGIDGIGNSTNQYCLAWKQWHEMVMISDGSSKMIYVNGERSYTGSSTAARYTLSQDGILFFTGGATSTWDQDIEVAEISIWDMALTEDELHRAAGLQKVNRQGWSVVSFSDGTNVNNLIDGNVGTAWVIASAPPHYVVLDLGEQRNIGRILVYGANAGAQMPINVRLSVSNNPTSGWTQAGNIYREVQGPNAGGGNQLLCEFPETSVVGRYLRIELPDRYAASLSLNEVSVFVKVE